MGLFDEITCEHPLPGDPPEFTRRPGHTFQTKSLDCTMAHYAITADGRLESRTAEGESWGGVARGLDAFTGTVEFHDGNAVAGAGGFSFTRDGSDAEWVTYEATFAGGRLSGIAEVERARRPALPVASMHRHDPPPATDEEMAGWRAREVESLAGRMMYRTWGTFNGSFEGEPVDIVADGEREWVARRPDGRFEIIARSSRDRLLFDSEEEARAAHRERNEGRERKKAAWATEMAEREGEP